MSMQQSRGIAKRPPKNVYSPCAGSQLPDPVGATRNVRRFRRAVAVSLLQQLKRRRMLSFLGHLPLPAKMLSNGRHIAKVSPPKWHPMQSKCAYGRGRVRVRPGILPAGCEPYNSTQHEADHCKNDETDVATREVLVIFDNAPAAAEPAIRALNYPAFG